MLLSPLLALGSSLALAGAPVTIDLDASDVARRTVHVKARVPVAAGPLTLHYPKWIPGEHGPTGPIDNVVGLQLLADGKPLAWRRDPVDMFALHLEVPPGVSAIEERFDVVAPTEGGAFSGSAIATENLAVLSWNHFLFAPEGPSDALEVQARLRVPRDWQVATAAPIARRGGSTVELAPASFTTLVDSPVLMGRYFTRVVLDELHAVDIAADSPAALAVPPETVTTWKQLVAEAGALFGNRHYRRYDFLLTLSDDMEDFGLEHHESSDDRVPERALLEKDLRPGVGGLLSHEFAHSWNGKYRRPVGLATGDYVKPMNDELLWVYEGLTEYLGMVLGARSGVEDGEAFEATAGNMLARIDQRAGRRWRPLQDTADMAQQLYLSPGQWTDQRRSVDFYPEGLALWLEVDTLLRAKSGGTKSLDDFVRAFHGGGAGGKPELVPYTFDELCAALDAVVKNDWRSFFRTRLDATSEGHPLDGLTAAGWRIGWVEERPATQAAWSGVNKVINEWFSIGLLIGSEDQVVRDVRGGSEAYRAGIAPGMKILGVDGRTFAPELLDDALKASKTRKAPLELLVGNGSFYRVAKLDYHQGKRYPRLERDPAKPDVLSKILAPKTPHAAPPADK